MLTRRRAALQIAVVVVWAVLVSTGALLVVFPLARDPWTSVVVQVVAYAVLVLPALVLRPRARLRLGGSRGTVLLSVLILIAATVFAGAVQHETVGQGLRHAVRAMSAGVGEEVVCRGFVFERSGRFIRSRPLRVVLGSLLFSAFHIPLVFIGSMSPLVLVITFGFGLLFGILRALSGLGLPAAVHVAVDLSS